MNAFKELFNTDSELVKLYDDELHSEMLQKGYTNRLIGLLVSEGYNQFDIIRSAKINPSEQYKMDAGMLRTEADADFILVDSFVNMDVLETGINGKKVFAEGKVYFKYKAEKVVYDFKCKSIAETEILTKNWHSEIRVIVANEGELLNDEIHAPSGKADYVFSEAVFQQPCPTGEGVH